MRRLAVLLSLVAAAGHAEQWSDEPERQEEFARPAPRFGLTGGLHATLTARNDEAPFPAARLGLRVRVAEHLAIAMLAVYELESALVVAVAPLTAKFEVSRVPVHLVQGVVRLELFTTSAFECLLIPELGIGAFVGLGAAHAPAFTPSTVFVVRSGVSLSLARLQPTGWWFPLSVELGQEFSPGAANAWYFAVGVGL